MNKNYTLKELADIGAKAACFAEKESKCTWFHAITVDASKPLYEETSVNREAFTKAVLDAVGYEFPKDEEREAFERWVADYGDNKPDLFSVWSAGREELRRAQMTAKEPGEKKTETAWIPWDGGECPLADGVKRWEYRTRGGFESIDPTLPKLYRWIHTGDCDDIMAYRVLKV